MNWRVRNKMEALARRLDSDSERLDRLGDEDAARFVLGLREQVMEYMSQEGSAYAAGYQRARAVRFQHDDQED